MSDDRFEKIERLFGELAQLDGEGRRRRLDEIGAEDPTLRSELESLLQADRGDPSRISDLIRSEEHALDDDELVGQRIGPCTLIERIGSGGFGTVYLAEQETPIRRRVALKVIRPGMASAEIVARFESERQALARMDHPSIAKVFDAGTAPGGRPYFTMELVEGPRLTDYCDGRRLDVRQRLTLFVQVARAVQHAHQKGVIHRDLKPGNILVAESDGVPIPKVIDFGIAKAVRPDAGGAALTRTMQLVGTPEYMSPEQASPGDRDVDTRSDVYSLGAVLYELLTGVTPFSDQDLRRAGLEEILRILREEDPRRPSERWSDAGDGDEAARRRGTQRLTLNRILRGDLDWIVMKALEKDPGRRYDSVGALADDIRRHLDDEPVMAGPPGAGYRLRKLVRRHRTAVIAAALVAISLAGGLTAALIGLRQARLEQARARAAENEQRIEAETARQVSDFLVDLFVQSRPTRPGSGDVTARELLDAGAERLETELADQPDIRARLLTVIGRVYGSMDLRDQERALVEEALRIRRELHPGDHDDIADGLNALGAVRYRAGDLEEAGRLYREALEMRRRLHGGDDVSVANDLAAVATVDRFLNDLDEAEASLRRALEIYEIHPDVDADALVRTRGDLAGVLMAQGRTDEAEAAYRRQIDDCERLYGEESACVGEATGDLAVLLKNRGAFDEAEPFYFRTLEVRRKIYGDDHEAVAQILNNISAFFRAAERYDPALDFARQAVEVYERVGGETPQLAFGLHTRARALMGLRRYREALADAERARRVLRATTGEGYWVVHHVGSTIGECLVELGRPDAARVELEAAHAGLVATLGPDNRHTRLAAERLGTARAGRGGDR